MCRLRREEESLIRPASLSASSPACRRRLLGFPHEWQGAFLFLVSGPVCFSCLPPCGVVGVAVVSSVLHFCCWASRVVTVQWRQWSERRRRTSCCEMEALYPRGDGRMMGTRAKIRRYHCLARGWLGFVWRRAVLVCSLNLCV